MLQVRNTLVAVRLIDKAEQKIGQFVVPSHADEYNECEVLAVGPGTLSASGGQSETFDLRVGQRVVVKTKARDPRSNTLVLAGIRYNDGGEFLHIFEQSSIIGIIAEPGTFPDSKPSDPSDILTITN